jgi:ribokinase
MLQEKSLEVSRLKRLASIFCFWGLIIWKAIMTVLVFGSINMDLVVRAPHLPLPGQTLSGQTFYTAPGGKGANQAVASARLGAHTRMIGCVGRDVFGQTLRQSLADYGVDISQVRDQNGPSGVALITIDDQAENTIVIIAGANGLLKADAATLSQSFDDARILLLQLEVPLAETIEVARQARTHKLMVILDPAPAQPLPPELYKMIDLITPNESEAAQLVGFPVQDETSAAKAADQLLANGVREVIIKLGSKGIYWANSQAGRLVRAYPVTAVDTVAAGDAFNGGLAAALDEGHPLETAIQWGLATAAIAVTRVGAQPSMPNRDEMIEMLRSKRD